MIDYNTVEKNPFNEGKLYSTNIVLLIDNEFIDIGEFIICAQKNICAPYFSSKQIHKEFG